MNGLQRAKLLVDCLPKLEADAVLHRLPTRRALAIRGRSDQPLGHESSYNSKTSSIDRREVVAAFMEEVGHLASNSLENADLLRTMPPSELADRLAIELNQVVALVLRELGASRAADVLTHFSEERQVKIVERMIDSDRPDHEVQCIVESAVSQPEPTPTADARRPRAANGAQHVALMLKHSSDDTKRRLAAGLRARRVAG